MLGRFLASFSVSASQSKPLVLTCRNPRCFLQEAGAGPVAPTLQYTLPSGRTIALDHAVRVTSFDPVFEGVGVDGDSIPIAVLESLLRCPRDIRKALAQSVVVCGGTASTSGFKAR